MTNVRTIIGVTGTIGLLAGCPPRDFVVEVVQTAELQTPLDQQCIDTALTSRELPEGLLFRRSKGGWIATTSYSLIRSDQAGEVSIEQGSSLSRQRHELFAIMQEVVPTGDAGRTIPRDRWERVERATRSFLLRVLEQCAAGKQVALKCERTHTSSEKPGCLLFSEKDVVQLGPTS